MAISIWDHLLCFKSGDEKWTTLKDRSAKIVDIIVYRGNFYAVDTYGETIMYDPSSFNETNVSSNVKGLSSSIFNGWGSKKRLVESGGELFLVDMFLDTDVKAELHGSQPSWKVPRKLRFTGLMKNNMSGLQCIHWVIELFLLVTTVVSLFRHQILVISAEETAFTM
uniref:Putative ovule protein n=1 Tax=Solanum chacoense TaxID=4108 RepID=A0A0V0HRT6_SOLCH